MLFPPQVSLLLSFLLFAVLAKATPGDASFAHDELRALAATGGGVIKLDTSSYELLMNPNRHWSASIHFTALNPRFGCSQCKQFDPSWKAVASSWMKTTKASRDNHFFGTLDFDDGQHVFSELGIAAAPVVLFFPALEGPHSTGRSDSVKYDFSEGFGPEPLVSFLSRYTPIAIPYSAPLDYAFMTTAFLLTITSLVALPFLLSALRNRWTWAAGSVFLSIVMTSGFMFTRIRHSPPVGRDGQWVASGPQTQYGGEVYIITALYSVLGLAFIMLTMVIPRQPALQRAQLYLWSLVIALVYSMLVALFKSKMHYPFKMLF
ncbi:hypothetical protein FB45DRAFT_1063265 [Roridomyces roridus]|uniref:Oligosaccharyl transferase subunit OST3/OST6 family n=1 Tax=Roridomyces roridus TaxID=1738132 RepID=A0AAD7BEI7_9AGAR|nr:hypothetical protein FB45DRAFT_1063265 [Roridomyces roridus]